MQEGKNEEAKPLRLNSCSKVLSLFSTSEIRILCRYAYSMT